MAPACVESCLGSDTAGRLDRTAGVDQLTELPLAAQATTYLRDPGEVLGDVVRASARLTGLPDLPDLVDQLTELTLEATKADRVSFFLLGDDGATLTLWAAAGRGEGDALWARGLEMPAIILDESPIRRELFNRGEAVAVADATSDPLIPREWADAFELASLVVAPLRHGGRPLGLLVVDWKDHRSLPVELVNLVGAIAGAAALAVANASSSSSLADRAAGLRVLLDACEALNQPLSAGEVAEAVLEPFARVLAGTHVSVHLFDRSTRLFETLATRGVLISPDGGLASLPPRVVAHTQAIWRSVKPRRPVVLTSGDELMDARPIFTPPAPPAMMILPLVRTDGELMGFVIVGFDGLLDEARMELAQTLAVHVAGAVERSLLRGQVAVGAEFARSLLAVTVPRQNDGPHATALLDDLRRVVPPTLGFEVLDVHMHRSGTKFRTEHGQELWRRWRDRRARPPIEMRDGDAYAPIWGGTRVLGMVRSRPIHGALAPHENSLLEALAGALGEAEERERSRKAIELRERELGLAVERAAVANELLDVMDRFLSAVERAAAPLAVHRPSADAFLQQQLVQRTARLAALATDGVAELRATARSLGEVRYDASSLGATLSEIIEHLASQVDAAVDLEVRGEPRPLAVEVEQALVRVTQEALVRVERDARPTAVAIRLEYRDDDVLLRVRDDGVDLDSRAGLGSALHLGLRLMRGRVEALGGHLGLDRAVPRGLLLTATVPG
jgi:signal transduction histidine kinase